MEKMLRVFSLLYESLTAIHDVTTRLKAWRDKPGPQGAHTQHNAHS